MRKLLTLLSLITIALSFQNASAQDDFPGYIVLVSGDTLHGLLKSEGVDRLLDQVVFKPSAATADFKTYSPSQVSSFKFDNGNRYFAITFSNVLLEHPVYQTHYAKLLVTGEYDLYSFRENGALYFLAKHDTAYRLLYDDDLHVMPYVKGNFRNELNYFAVFCDASKSGIENIMYSEEQLVKFFLKIDACMEPDKKAETFYRKRKTEVGFFAYIGGSELGSQRSQFTAEVRFKLVDSQINPNLSLNIGLRYASLVKKDLLFPTSPAPTLYPETYSIKSLPATVQYNFTHGIVQPFIYAGFSLLTLGLSSSEPITYGPHYSPLYYHSADIEWLAGAGVEVKIAGFLRARAEWRYEYIAQWPTLGLALCF